MNRSWTNGQEWESNPRACWKSKSKPYKCQTKGIEPMNLSKVWNGFYASVRKMGVKPWIIGKVWKEIQTCERIATTGSRTHDVCMAKIVLNLFVIKIFFFFLYLDFVDGKFQLWVCCSCSLWSWSLFIWTP